MNRYIRFLVIVMAFVLPILIFGCSREPNKEISVSTTQQTEETTPLTTDDQIKETEEFTFPKGEGNEPIDDVANNEGTETNSTEATNPSDKTDLSGNTKPNNYSDSTENTKPNDKTDSAESTKPSDKIEPTEDTRPNDKTNSTENTKPNNKTDTTEDTNINEGTNPTEDTKPSEGPCCDYSLYLEMSPSEQQAYMKNFPTTMAFIEWCREAEVTHKEHDNSTIVEGGELDVGDFIDKNKGGE